METISKAILSKVRAEAQNIIAEAEKKAREEIEKAKTQREVMFEQERRQKLEEAEAEAARILAQASIKARQELSRAKADAVAKLLSKVKENLSQLSSDETSLVTLIKEAMDGLGRDKGRIYVSAKDVSTVRKLLERHRELARRIAEVKEFEYMGGVIAEDMDGKFRIDNSYETRLAILLPKLLPQISRELF